MLDKYDLSILQELLNEAILENLLSGCKLTDEYVIRLRIIIKKLNLEEVYNFDKKFKE